MRVRSNVTSVKVIRYIHTCICILYIHIVCQTESYKCTYREVCIQLIQESTKKLSVKKLPIVTCFHLKVYIVQCIIYLLICMYRVHTQAHVNLSIVCTCTFRFVVVSVVVVVVVV